MTSLYASACASLTVDPSPTAQRTRPPLVTTCSRLHARSGVKHLAGQRGSAIEPLDDIAFADIFGITRGGHHDAERRARIPLRRDRVQSSLESRLAQLGEIGLQAHQDGLRFRVAEPAVEFEHVGRAVRARS